jgi:hypothetical protein
MTGGFTYVRFDYKKRTFILPKADVVRIGAQRKSLSGYSTTG